MISIAVPIGVGEIFGRNAVYHQIAVGVAIQTADDVQKRRFAAARRPQNGNEFVFAEFDVHAPKRVHFPAVADVIILHDVF